MMRTILLRLVLAVAPLIAASAASAADPTEQLCDKREKILQTLEHQYGELEVGYGVTMDGALLELATAKDGVTWTLVRTAPTGESCLVAAGQKWAARSLPVKQAEVLAPY
jgi:hypothetical protein